MCTNASAARRWRSASVNPPAATAASTASYVAGEVTMATLGWFLAAARTIDGPADVDLLDALVGAGARGDGLGEGVEVAHHEVERLDAELLELRHVGLEAAVGEDPGVHARVQRLDPAVEALGEAGEVLHLGDGQAERLDERGGPAGGDELDAGRVQAADQVVETGLVVDGDERALDRRSGRRCVSGVGDTGLLGCERVRGHPGVRCSRASLPGGGPPAPVVWRQTTEQRRRCEPGGPPPRSPRGRCGPRRRRASRARRS